MEKRIENLGLFIAYAKFILAEKLDELVWDTIKAAREMNLPLLKHLEQLPEKELFEISKQGTVEFLSSIVEGRIKEATEASTARWKANKLDVIDKNKLIAKDIALIYFIRKTTLFQLLPSFAKDLTQAIPLLKEIESYFSYQESQAIETFAEINREEIQKSENRLKEAQNLAQLGCWDYDLEKGEITWSEELYHIYGIESKETIQAEKIKSFILEEDLGPLTMKVRELYETGGSFTREYRIRRADGEIRTLVDKAYVEEISGFKILKGISQDITERKRVEEELQSRETSLEEAQSIAHLGSWEWDTVKNIVSWSNEMYRVFGYEPGEIDIDYATYLSHIHPEDVEMLKSRIEDCYLRQIPYVYENRIVRKDKQVRWLFIKGQVSMVKDDQVLKLSGIAMDITDQKEVMDKLESSEKQFRLLAEHSSDVITLVAPNGRITYVSPACYSMFGYTTHELQEGSVFDFVHPEDLPKEGRELWLQQQVANAVELRWKKKEGEYLWVEAVGKSIFDLNGNVLELRISFRNISDRKKAQEQSKKNEMLLLETQEISSVGSYEWNLVQDTSLSTPEVRRIFGQEEGEGKGFKDFTLCLHPDDKDKVEKAMSLAFTSGIYECEYRIFREKDRQLRHLWTKARLTFDEHNKPFKLIGSIMDITERKLVEEALMEKTEALIASNKELEAFCYTVSHDLRSPLRAIDGFGRKLATQYETALDEEGRRLLHVVRSNAQRMGILIDSLLDFSRLNRREIKKYPTRMEEVVRKVIEECEEQNQENNAVFHVNTLMEAHVDRELIHQVWQNLISNAIKFSSKVANPEITLGSERKGDKVIYFVQDNGAGFEMQYKDKLFGVFQRLHTDAEFSGTGVGLATVQRIVHRHGGQVWAEGSPENGATFYFSLPLK